MKNIVLKKGMVNFIISTVEKDRNNRIWLKKGSIPACKEEVDATRAIASRLGRSPIITELPENIAVPLWCVTGSWIKMLNKCSLPRTSLYEEYIAGMAYGLAHCGTQFFPEKKWNRLIAREKALLSDVCNLALEIGRTPDETEIPQETQDLLIKLFGTLKLGLIQLGLVVKSNALVKHERTYGISVS